MERVITINLNGEAFQLDERGYDRLRAYLDGAAAALHDNSDRAEILLDLERAIAEKCRRQLNPHKSVITTAEIEQILTEMGPVEGGAESTPPAGDDPAAAAGARPAKRLYRIRQSMMLGGVCTGLAAYFGTDVVFVRLAFVVLTIFAGWGLLLYWILVFIVPEARTSEERAAAHGQRFSAKELIDQAKKTAADVRDQAGVTGSALKRQWRQQRRHWQAQHRAWRRGWQEHPGEFVHPGVVAWAAATGPVVTVLSLAAVALLIVAITSVMNTGVMYGWHLPADVPRWAGILILIALFHLVTAPLRAVRRASYQSLGPSYGWLAAWNGVIATALTIFGIWVLARHMSPIDDFGDFIQQLPDAIRAVGHDIVRWF